MTSDPKTPSGADEEAFEKRAQKLLQSRAEELDGATRSRLTQARHAALNAVKATERNSISWWLPASGAAAAVLAVLLAFNSGNVSMQREDAQVALAPLDEFEIVTAEDSLEFYRDVEFYAWLDTVLEEEPAEPSGA